MSKELEIERKFLLKNIPDGAPFDSIVIDQYYLPKDEDGYTVRIRKSHGSDITYWLTKKKFISPTVNEEIEKQIDGDEFIYHQSKALTKLSKTRFLYSIDGLTWEVDCFYGMQLIIAEVELESEDYELEIPDVISSRLIKEVSGIKEFYNQSLSEAV